MFKTMPTRFLSSQSHLDAKGGGNLPDDERTAPHALRMNETFLTIIEATLEATRNEALAAMVLGFLRRLR